MYWIAFIIAFGTFAGLLSNLVDEMQTLVQTESLIQKSEHNNKSQLCESQLYEPIYKPFSATIVTRQVEANPVLFSNVTIFTGKGQILYQQDLLIENGMISAISATSLTPTEQTRVFSGNGRVLTPGLIDMHSHLTVDSFPADAFGNGDDNEMTTPLTPFVRSLDGMNLNDIAINKVREGGVTSSLILPGSGNVMGGEAFLIKLKEQSVERALFPGIDKRYFKMACGENPKAVYGLRNPAEMPMTRMGSAWLMREAFYQAAELKRAQTQWDCQYDAGTRPLSARPQDLKLEPLVSILSDQALLNVHCYKVEDMQMVIRLSHEFNFSIAAFHHAHEAWKIADLLKQNNIGAAIFSELGLYKMEAYQSNTHNPQILADNGVKWAFVSDHPVTNSRELIEQVRRTQNYNPDMNPQTIFASVTSVPAQLLGIANRVGSIEVGKEADLVLWNDDPFLPGSLPDIVSHFLFHLQHSPWLYIWIVYSDYICSDCTFTKNISSRLGYHRWRGFRRAPV